MTKEVTIDVPEDDGNAKQAAAAKNDDGKTKKDDSGPSDTDLVIREGFPALRLPNTKYKPMIDGEEPIPRHAFWAKENAIQFHPDQLENLRSDCETVFTARDKPDGQTYSAGQTFFLPALMKPRCALEALAQSIFKKHVEHLEDGTYIPEQSGAEWWTLVMDVNDDAKKKDNNDDDEEEDDDDEVGLHFDADYELEDQVSNMLLHPRIATVTYLSDFGAPTLVLDQKSPPMDDLQKKTLEGGIDRAWLSHPHLGKHTAFDGRLLHGAPALYFPPRKDLPNDGEESSAKRQKIIKKRYTFLVNVWLNHCVMDAGLLDEEVCAKLQTPWEAERDSSDGSQSSLKGDDSYIPPFVWQKDVDLSKPPESVEKTKLSPSNIDPAGEDEIALCNHNVTVKYNALMGNCHKASSIGNSIEIELEKDALILEVGEELPEASDDEAE